MSEPNNQMTAAECQVQLGEALAKVSALETENKQLKAQLSESTDAMQILKTKFDTAEKAEKTDLINELFRDSNGKLSKDSLETRTLTELYLIKDAIAQAEPKTFVSVMRQKEKDKASPPKPHGTVGIYNPSTKKWEDGV